MPSTDKMIKNEVRKLARKGKLVDEAFKMFARAIFPRASPDQVAVMRTCFYAGAAELHAIHISALDDCEDVTDGDEVFYGQVCDEIEQYHARIIATASARGSVQ
jgi:hypothetical protein